MVQRALFFLSAFVLTMALAYAIHQNPQVLMSGLTGTVPRPEWWPRERVALNLAELLVPFIIWVCVSWAYVQIAARRFFPARNFIRLAAFMFVAQVYILMYGLPHGLGLVYGLHGGWGWPLSLLLVTLSCEGFSSDYLKRAALSIPPPIVLWEKFPDLTVAVFGSFDKTPDLANIRNAYGSLVRHVFSTSQATPIENRPGVVEAYARKVAEQLNFEEIPDVSEMGSNDRANRLFSVHLMGMVWLLLNEGAAISEQDASLIPAVVSEFAREPLCLIIQGRGHLLFLNSRLARRLCIGDGRSLWKKAEESGLIARRVRYITIDPRSSDRFDLL